MFENSTFRFSVMNAVTAGWTRKAGTRQRDSQSEGSACVAVAMVLGLGDRCGGRREEGDSLCPSFREKHGVFFYLKKWGLKVPTVLGTMKVKRGNAMARVWSRRSPP